MNTQQNPFCASALRIESAILPASKPADDDRFYVQDSRHPQGPLLWWRWDRSGYTQDLKEALVVTRDEGLATHQSRETDIPWPASYVESALDSGLGLDRADLLSFGIVLATPASASKPARLRCMCGSFISQANFHVGQCPRCGAR